MVTMKRKLRTSDLVAFTSMKWKTVAPVENDKGERLGWSVRFPRAERRAANRIIEWR